MTLRKPPTRVQPLFDIVATKMPRIKAIRFAYFPRLGILVSPSGDADGRKHGCHRTRPAVFQGSLFFIGC